MDATTEPAAPVAEAPEMSLEDIVAAAVNSAGTDVVKPDEPAKAEEPAKVEGTDATPPAETAPAAETPAEEPKPDDVTAARVRKMLAAVEEREAALAARESQTAADILAQLLKAPKSTLAKYGKSIDDVIDASIAEGKEPAEAAPADDRLTALERRIEARERAEAQARHDAAIAGRKAEIHRAVTAEGAKYPALIAGGRVEAVTDYMLEFHAVHGKPISWDRAAAAIEKDLTGVGIAVAKKMGWTAPAAKPAPAAERPGTVSISGDQRTSAPVAASEPEDPDQLLSFLVKQAGL